MFSAFEHIFALIRRSSPIKSQRSSLPISSLLSDCRWSAATCSRVSCDTQSSPFKFFWASPHLSPFTAAASDSYFVHGRRQNPTAIYSNFASSHSMNFRYWPANYWYLWNGFGLAHVSLVYLWIFLCSSISRSCQRSSSQSSVLA